MTKEILSLDRINALNEKALEIGLKPLYKVNEVVESVPEGALPTLDLNGCVYEV